MNEQKQTDLERARIWLSGEVRLSRNALVLGGVIMLVLLGVALD